MIDAHTWLTGVLGYPVRHSLSPAMHNAAFQSLGLNGVYLAFEVAPDRLADAIQGMRGLKIRGLNLTIPHKEAVIPLLDGLTDAASRIGAVNTLFWDGDRLMGDNTDAEGFLRVLREGGVNPAHQTVLVLGAGGAARAVVYALQTEGCTVILANRSLDRAHALAEAFGVGTVLPLERDALAPHAAQIHGVVNCTALGMTPNEASMPPLPLEALPEACWVCDLVYRPLETRLLQAAKAHGLKTIDGLGMLAHQGALAFERWTGAPAPVSVMRDAALHALGL
ncbi:MAG: shikimate dehydrogenase [Fimbriimonadales bacterium]|nr:MAG: shikimate dehydrogenase (NADP(+)) [Fimbriimonadales bacterium]